MIVDLESVCQSGTKNQLLCRKRLVELSDGAMWVVRLANEVDRLRDLLAVHGWVDPGDHSN